MRICRFRLVLAVAVALPAAAGAQAAPLSADAQDRLAGLLRAYEHQPTADELRALGEGVKDALIAVAQDEAEAPFVRGRAVWALGFFPDDAVRRTIDGLLDRPDLSDMILRRALDALARGFGDAARSRIAPYLDDGRPDVREAAAEALGAIGTPGALRALRRRLDRETLDSVRATIGRVIRRLEEVS